MIITQHGKTDPLYKGVARHGRTLVFFGWSVRHVQLKHQEWLLANQPVKRPRQKARPVLTLVANRA